MKGIRLGNTGGPKGYCYNIQQVSSKLDCGIDFYSVTDPYVLTLGERPVGSFKHWLRTLQIFTKTRDILYMYFRRVPLTNEEISLLNQYEYVHCHIYSHLADLLAYKNRINTKIIYTTHTPEPCIDELSGHSKYLPSFIRNYFIKKEADILSKVDYLMYPVREALEVYTNASPIFAKAYNKNASKLFFVPTGIINNSVIANPSLLDFLQIPKDSLKVCYIGRHNEVKGYDQLQHFTKKCWNENIDINVIVGGKESPIKGLEDSRWHELGWVNTKELLHEVDVFILPNKCTFFDIIMVEVLSCGIPVIATRTGGNKWYDARKTEGMRFYNYGDYSEFRKAILYFAGLKKNGLLKKAGEANRTFFLQNLTTECFITNYRRQIDHL